MMNQIKKMENQECFKGEVSVKWIINGIKMCKLCKL